MCFPVRRTSSHAHAAQGLLLYPNPNPLCAAQGLLPRKPATARCLNPRERMWLQNRQDTLDAKAHARDARAGKWWVRASRLLWRRASPAGLARPCPASAKACSSVRVRVTLKCTLLTDSASGLQGCMVKWELWYLSFCYALVQWSITAVVYFNPVSCPLEEPPHASYAWDPGETWAAGCTVQNV